MKTAKKILFFSITLTISVLMSLQASNVRITTPRVVYAGSDDALASSIPVTNDSIAMIIFDISWENSWRTVSPNNWDAVWLFVKFYDGTTWLPTFLDKDPSNHVAGNPSENGYYVTTKANPSNVKGGMTIKPGFSTSYNQYRGTYGKECVGVFLYRSELGEGKVRIKSVNLKWNYKNQGQVKDNDLVVKVFAVEMVYVREGEFYVGDGSTTSTGGFVKSSGTTPFGLNAYKILSENEITVGNTQDNLWTYNDAQPVLINNLEIPKTFPKGYRAFYAMKYELTQEAYGEMLNCLSSQQANRNTPVYDEVAYANTVGSLNVGSVQGAGGWGPNNNGNPIKRVVLSWKKGSGGQLVYGCDANADGIFNQTKKNIDDTTFVYIYDVDTMSVSWDGQDLPMHWISYDQVLAYAAFAGLRPMTEFEYEKLCRGPKAPVAGEYAWGSSSIQFLDNPITFDLWSTYVMHNWLAGYEWVGTGREAPNRSLGVNAGTGGHNHSHRAWSWGGWAMNMGGELLRVGCFADTNTNRISSGAGYWGAMNLTDNAYEPCVRVGTDESKTFLGVHGSGYLDQEGYYMAFKDTGGGMNSNPWLLNKGQTSVKIYMLRGVLVYWNRDIGLGGNWNGYWDDNVKIPNGYYAEWAQGTISFRQRSGGYDHDPHTIADNNKDFLGIRCVRTEDAAE